MDSEIGKILYKKEIKFSKGQKKIAAFIEENYDKAAFMTASKLGKAVGVSESTVVRFASELGYDGYPGFQSELSDLIKNKLTSVQRVEVASEQIGGDVLGGVLNLDIEMIKKTTEEIDRSAFSEAVVKIAGARNIYIIGVRSAYSLANFLYFYFRMFFGNVFLVDTTSSAELFETIVNISKEDVLIAISFPRYSKRTVKAAKFAKSGGADVIAITDSATSPLASHADELLVACSGTTTFVDSLVAPMSLCNALASAVGLCRKEEVSRTFERLEKIWDEYDVYEKGASNE